MTPSLVLLTFLFYRASEGAVLFGGPGISDNYFLSLEPVS